MSRPHTAGLAGVLARAGSARFRSGRELQLLAFSPDGRSLAGYSWDGITPACTLSVWKVAAGRLRQHFTLPRYGAHHARFSPDGSLLTVLGGEKMLVRRVLAVSSGRERDRLEVSASASTPATFLPDGGILMTSPDRQLLARLGELAEPALRRPLTAAPTSKGCQTRRARSSPARSRKTVVKAAGKWSWAQSASRRPVNFRKSTRTASSACAWNVS